MNREAVIPGKTCRDIQLPMFRLSNYLRSTVLIIMGLMLLQEKSLCGKMLRTIRKGER
jgi:hypothetical protein